MDAEAPASNDRNPATPSLPALYTPGLAKFIVMNVTTFGFYSVYWGYRNWKLMRLSGRTDAWPLLCGIFLPLTLYSLIQKTTRERDILSLPSDKLTMMAIFYFGLNLMSRIPGLGDFISLVTFVPLIFVNQYFAMINELNRHDTTEIERFSESNLVIAILGSILIALALVGMSSDTEEIEEGPVPTMPTKRKV